MDGHTDRAHEFGPYAIDTSSGDTAATAAGAWYADWPRTGLGAAALAALAAAAILLIRRSRRDDATRGALASYDPRSEERTAAGAGGPPR